MSDPHQTWKDSDGDNTLALDWPIDQDSLVWEIGGFEGRWAAQMAEKFNPWMEIFEPQLWAEDKLKMRFRTNSKVLIHPYGLWTGSARLPMGDFGTDGASLLKKSDPPITGRFVDIRLDLERTECVDVCLMNIEGAEFELLPYLFGHNLISRFRFFWCQFHPDLFAGSEIAMRLIYAAMSRDHDLLWDYYPTAVAWRRRE